MSLLMRTPRPLPDESPRGYLIRLVEENGYDEFSVLLHLLGLVKSPTITVGWDYRQLKSLVGAHAISDVFGYCAPRKGSRVRSTRAHVLGRPIRTCFVDVQKARVCPQCLSDAAYVRCLWDVSLVRACPAHGCELLSACPACGKSVRQSRARTCHCSCGFDLRQSRITAAAPSQLAVAELVQAKLSSDLSEGGGCVVARSMGIPVSDLLGLDLDVLCEVLVTLAAVDTRVLRSDPRRTIGKTLPHIGAAADILSYWPFNFHAMCKRWMLFRNARPKSASHKNFHTTFRWLFEGLYKNLRSKKSQTTFLLKAAYVFGMRHWDQKPIRIRQVAMRSIELPPPRYVSSGEAARQLRIPVDSLLRALRSGIVPAKRIGTGGSGSRWLVELESLPDVADLLASTVGVRQAPAYLGLPHSVYKGIRWDRSLVPRGMRTATTRRLSKSDLDGVLTALRARVRTLDPTQTYNPLGTFLRSHVPTSFKVGQIAKILRGELQVYSDGSSDVRFANVWVDVDLLEGEPLGSDSLTFKQVAQITGLYPGEIRAASALLPSSAHPVSHRALLYRRSDVNAFCQDYVSIRHIAREAQLPNGWLIWRLRKTHPELLLSFPQGNTGRTYFSVVRRTDEGKVKAIAATFDRGIPYRKRRIAAARANRIRRLRASQNVDAKRWVPNAISPSVGL